MRLIWLSLCVSLGCRDPNGPKCNVHNDFNNRGDKICICELGYGDANDTKCSVATYPGGFCCADPGWPGYGNGNLTGCWCSPQVPGVCFQSSAALPSHQCYCKPGDMADGGSPADPPEPSCAPGAVYQVCCQSFIGPPSCVCRDSATDCEFAVERRVDDCQKETALKCDSGQHMVTSCSN
jgi:hypothetical protein